VHTNVFSDCLVLEGALRSSVVCCYYGTHFLWSIVKLEAKNNMEDKFCGLAMTVRVVVAMRNLLGDL
jgi:hypothetical protein